LYSGRGRFFPNDYSLANQFVLFVLYSRPIVAVIEADATDRRMLCSLLSKLNADVQDYDSAESYLASPDGIRGGCLITDMVLPGMSGLELLKQLRSRHTSTPVILLGEDADVRAAVAAMREGAVDFIEKTHVDFSIVRRVAYLLDHTHTH
jgi:FixJ family two-component response regulator